MEIKDRVYTVPITKYLDTNNYIFYKGQLYYPFKSNIDYQKRETIIADITAEIAATNNNLKSNASFGDNASYKIGDKETKEQINVKLDAKIYLKNFR